MPHLQIAPLREGLPFGVAITGLTSESLEDESTRATILDAFETHGMIVFRGVEPADAMQVALSEVFGPLKDHPVKSVARVDNDRMPGLIEIKHEPGSGGRVRIGGRERAHWLPWHFDHCYNNELNRAGVLRATQIATDGGLTRFADGIAIYRAFPPELLRRIEREEVLYSLRLPYGENRFGMPPDMEEISEKPGSRAIWEEAKSGPRAVHPAVWERDSGEKVLHVSPWMSEGLAGREDAEGDALLKEVCQTINRIADSCCYEHEWHLTDMVVWDNWRMLHGVSGNDPAQPRAMQRTTIKGDYGLGRFENASDRGGKLQEMTV